MRATIIRTGIMSIFLFAASAAVALAGPTHRSQSGSHGSNSDHNGWQSDNNGRQHNHDWRGSDEHGNRNDDKGGRSDDNGHRRRPSQVPITEGLPFLAIAGGAYGMYALTKYRAKSKSK